MAGNGPPPKPPGRAARRNANSNVTALRVIKASPKEQPPLPTFQITFDGKLQEFRWPQQTVEWWKSWAETSLSDDFGATDWDFLLDTAVLHAAYWQGNLTCAGELRLRVAKLGATPEDRLRLRIQFELADEATDKGQRRRNNGKPSRSTTSKKDDPRQGLAG